MTGINPPIAGHLMDTNLCVALLNGDTAAVARLKSLLKVYVPVVTAAELYFGAEKSAQQVRNR